MLVFYSRSSLNKTNRALIHDTVRIAEKIFPILQDSAIHLHVKLGTSEFGQEIEAGAEMQRIGGSDFSLNFCPGYLDSLTQQGIVETVGHELTHLKQYVEDGLDMGSKMEDPVMFQGNSYRFENDMEYWLSPWEIEARGYEKAFAQLYWRLNDQL